MGEIGLGWQVENLILTGCSDRTRSRRISRNTTHLSTTLPCFPAVVSYENSHPARRLEEIELYRLCRRISWHNCHKSNSCMAVWEAVFLLLKHLLIDGPWAAVSELVVRGIDRLKAPLRNVTRRRSPALAAIHWTGVTTIEARAKIFPEDYCKWLGRGYLFL